MTVSEHPTPNEPFETAARTYAIERVKDYFAHDPDLSPDVAADLVRISARMDHKDLGFQIDAAAAALAQVYRLRGGSR